MAGYGVFDRIFAFQINPFLKIVSLIFLFVITSLQECFVYLSVSYIVNLVLRILVSIFRLQNFRRFYQIQTDGEPVIYAVPKSFNAGEPVNGYRFCNSVLSHDAPVKQVFPAIKEQNCTCYMVNFSIIKFAEAIFYPPPPGRTGDTLKHQ